MYICGRSEKGCVQKCVRQTGDFVILLQLLSICTCTTTFPELTFRKFQTFVVHVHVHECFLGN